MTKTIKIPTSKITQFEAKQTPTIQQEKNIIKKDNIGTVVPGDALRNINLSTVPSVIEDAIKQMALSVEAKVLANALLLQIQRDIENLGDAIVEKSYIDGQVTYLTNIVNQKSDKGDVASIVDSKLAIVTPTLATANQVIHLSSRLDESQSSINEVKQTINTEKQALISMIEEAEAKVDENLSNYSAVLNLTVDEDGNIVSQKLESLISQNNNLRISIDELEETMLDEFGNWSAKVAKFITDNNGNITGFSFANGSGQTSKFKINADNFQISNSSNSYVPFKIEGNNLIFNGKVTFSNITGGDSIITKENIQNAVNNNVTTIDGGKIVTNQAFVNNLNAVGGVTADTINGNTLNGIVINGARINGSVIKTSYLDLDGELEVLTNYHITVAMYNANPSLYTDAVYISADNEYRIPSMSTIQSVNIQGFYDPIEGKTGTYQYSSPIYAYNIANAGTNQKVVKARPTITLDYSGNSSGGNNIFSSWSGTYLEFAIYLGTQVLFRCTKSGSNVSITGFNSSPYNSSSNTYVDYSFCGITFRVIHSSSGVTIHLSSTILTLTLSSDWNTKGTGIRSYCTNSGGFIGTFYHPKISINNMI
ncbi:hypothetical protein N5U36_00600 [Aliarcobacter butzleri]|uniref:hypothetical protein n=1 Tax=Aliarcobacter butzleri TaxID=28197 RepID=UPI0021B4994F|nr:hypothetical protein [Aliarcobacter butzleri]MCT7633932.1 hypothetical protein [Aliarcobacter butzleri]